MSIKRFTGFIASPPGLLVLVMIAAHAALVVRHFPPSALSEGDAPVKGDLSRYLATVHGAKRVGGIHGYDPNFLAGYPVGLWNSMGKKGYELCAAIAPPERDRVAVYAVVVASALLAPFLLAAPTLLRQRSGWDVAIAAVLAFAAWHFSTQAAYFWHFGNVFYPFTCCLVPIALLLAERVSHQRLPVASAALLSAIAAFAFYAHTAASLVLWGVLFARTVYAFVRGKGFAGARLVMAGMLALAMISPWLLPLLANREICVSQPHEWFQSSVKHLICDLFSDRTYQQPFDRNALLHVFVIAGVAGLFGLASASGRPDDDSRDARRDANAVLWAGFAGLGCLFVAYTGSYLPVFKSIQPYRFLTPAVLLMVGPAVLAFRRAVDSFHRAEGATRATIGGMVLVILPSLSGYALDALQPPMRFGLSESERATLGTIAELPGRGRVLVETIQVGHLTPQMTGRAVIGGLSDQAFLVHRFAGIDGDGVLFGKHASDWDPDALREYLDLYAIEFALFASPEWTAFAESAPELFQSRETAGASCFGVVDAKPGLVFVGQAVVAADYDTIRVAEVESERLVLKLHFDKHFVSTDGVQIRPIRLLEDPAPFIELIVPRGVQEFELRFDPGA